MLPREVLRQIRRLQLRARRAVEDLLGGEYHSVFKGMGMVFEEVREYQPGDDVRTIDWNVTARMGHPFVKRYVEERELTVVLLVDWSGSHQFGTGRLQKREVAAELAAVLAFSAISNNDKVGLIGFTDQIECFVPPRKGTRHVLRLIREALYFQPLHQGTSLCEGLNFLNRILHRRAIVFLLTDFLDRGFEQLLKRTGRRHDLIAIHISDPREEELASVGLLELEDAETGKRILLDTSSRQVREGFAASARRRREEVRRMARSARIDLLDVATDGRHLEGLVHFFQQRERRLRKR
jgi:uncharacterized protein (DUF58 family)